MSQRLPALPWRARSKRSIHCGHVVKSSQPPMDYWRLSFTSSPTPTEPIASCPFCDCAVGSHSGSSRMKRRYGACPGAISLLCVAPSIYLVHLSGRDLRNILLDAASGEIAF